MDVCAPNWSLQKWYARAGLRTAGILTSVFHPTKLGNVQRGSVEPKTRILSHVFLGPVCGMLKLCL